jgi:hypothetical protein
VICARKAYIFARSIPFGSLWADWMFASSSWAFELFIFAVVFLHFQSDIILILDLNLFFQVFVFECFAYVLQLSQNHLITKMAKLVVHQWLLC